MGSYGLSVTTLEEVFLRVSEDAAAASAASAASAAATAAAASPGGTATAGPGGSVARRGVPGERQQGRKATAAAGDDGTSNGTVDGTAYGTAAAEVDRSEFVVVNLPRRCYLKVRAGSSRQFRAAYLAPACAAAMPQKLLVLRFGTSLELPFPW